MMALIRRPSAACGLLILAMPVLAAGHQETPPRAPRVIAIVAERFVFTPSEITVDEGTVVEFRLTSDDTSHGFHLIGPGGIDVEIPKRGRGDVRVTFEAREPGEYIFECSRICGAGHNFMRGSLRVKARGAAAGDGR